MELFSGVIENENIKKYCADNGISLKKVEDAIKRYMNFEKLIDEHRYRERFYE